jgi:hypothetical protein
MLIAALQSGVNPSHWFRVQTATAWRTCLRYPKRGEREGARKRATEVASPKIQHTNLATADRRHRYRPRHRAHTDTMLFSPPSDTKAKDRRWQEFAKVGFRDSRHLWTDYWQRFNTITIPLLDEDAFFSDALATAQVAQDRRHLEQLLEQKSKERLTELENVLGEILHAAIFQRKPSSPEAAWHTAEKVGRSGSLDSFVQLTSGIVWGWGDEQVGERRPRRESSPFTYTGTQRPSYSPHPEVCDTWDLMEHGLYRSVSEEPASPGRRQLSPPSPSPPRASSTAAPIEDGKISDGVGYSAWEGSPKAPTASSTTDPVEDPPPSPPANSCQAELPLPPSPSDVGPWLTASQATSTTPLDPPSFEEADIQPPLSTASSSPRQERRREPSADACRGSLGRDAKLRGKMRLHQLQDSDLEEIARSKRARRELG